MQTRVLKERRIVSVSRTSTTAFLILENRTTTSGFPE